MGMLGKVVGGILITAGALAGSYVGEALAKNASGTRGPASEPSPETLVANAIPAIAIALLTGWPRTLYAFLGGLISAALLGDRSPLLGLISRRQSPHHPVV